MQGGLGITYFQDTAKDMQMENCSSKSIRTRPYPPPEPKPPQEDGGNIAPPPALARAKSPWERWRWKNRQKKQIFSDAST